MKYEQIIELTSLIDMIKRRAQTSVSSVTSVAAVNPSVELVGTRWIESNFFCSHFLHSSRYSLAFKFRKTDVDVAKHIMSLCPKQKIIFATAYTLDALDGMTKKLKLGVDVFQKPFDLDAFAAMVEDLGQTLPKTS
jgi:hypothetical protein